MFLQVPIIDPYSSSGTFPSKLKGAISFQNVSFSYPIRKDIQVCTRGVLNLKRFDEEKDEGGHH